MEVKSVCYYCLVCYWCLCIVSMQCVDKRFSSSPADASTYAHYLFNAFDTTNSGSIKFEVCLILLQKIILVLFYRLFSDYYTVILFYQDFVTALSILLRGSITEKLQWTFNLYDINRDGYINKEVCFCAHMSNFELYFTHVVIIISHVFFICLCASVFGFPGDDRHRQSDIWHDGEVHIPSLENWRTQTACGCLFSGKDIRPFLLKHQHK